MGYNSVADNVVLSSFV